MPGDDEAGFPGDGDRSSETVFTETEELHRTEYTQIAMAAVEVSMLQAARQEGLEPDLYAGLSLGEYAALMGTGALTLEDGFHLVRQRGIFMDQAVPEGGAMTAVLGLSGEQVEEVCRSVTELSGWQIIIVRDRP